MKKSIDILYMLFFLSVLICRGQTQIDTLFSTKGHIVPCMITDIDSTFFQVTEHDDYHGKAYFKILEKIYLHGMGYIDINESLDKTSIQSFLLNRQTAFSQSEREEKAQLKDESYAVKESKMRVRSPSIAIFAQLNSPGKHKMVTEGLPQITSDVSSSFALGLEVNFSSSLRYRYGAGINYLADRTVTEKITDEYGNEEKIQGKISFIPIYLFVNIPLTITKYRPCIVGKFGYNRFTGDTDYQGSTVLSGSFMYAYGFSIIGEKEFIELLFSTHHGNATLPAYDFGSGTTKRINYEIDIKYTHFVIAIGLIL